MISSSASRQSRLTSGGQRLGRRRPRAAVRDSRTSAARTAGGSGRPPRAHGDADRAAPVGVPAERDLRRRSGPRSVARRRRRRCRAPGRTRARREQAELEHAQPLGAGPVARRGSRGTRAASRRRRLDLAGRAQLADQLGGVGGVRHARDVRRRARRGSRSRRSARASAARRRPARAAPPVPTRTAPSPPAKRRWLLRAPRASADSRPVVAAEQRHDPIRLAVAHGAQHDRGGRR